MVFCLCAAWTKDYWRRPRHVLDDNPLPAPVRREAPGRVLPVDAGGAELKAPRPHGGDAAALASLPPLLGCGEICSRTSHHRATIATRFRNEKDAIMTSCKCHTAKSPLIWQKPLSARVGTASQEPAHHNTRRCPYHLHVPKPHVPKQKAACRPACTTNY